MDSGQCVSRRATMSGECRSIFQYPIEPWSFRHGPYGYSIYEGYRSWVRDEYCFRCVYCLNREEWCNAGHTGGAFHIDHVFPKVAYPDLETSYENLVYACTRCNLAKGQVVLPDPRYVLTSESVNFHEDGTLEGTTEDAKRLIMKLGLDHPRRGRWSKLIVDIVKMAEHQGNYELVFRLLGFPDDLPDLSSKRPLGNVRPEGLGESWYEKKRNGLLPAVY